MHSSTRFVQHEFTRFPGTRMRTRCPEAPVGRRLRLRSNPPSLPPNFPKGKLGKSTPIAAVRGSGSSSALAAPFIVSTRASSAPRLPVVAPVGGWRVRWGQVGAAAADTSHTVSSSCCCRRRRCHCRLRPSLWRSPPSLGLPAPLTPPPPPAGAPLPPPVVEGFPWRGSWRGYPPGAPGGRRHEVVSH